LAILANIKDYLLQFCWRCNNQGGHAINCKNISNGWHQRKIVLVPEEDVGIFFLV
jgi:hypothetical protein